MEFDEMKKIWDTQTNEPLYVLNEKAFHNQIQLKKRKTTHVLNLSELVTIIVFTLAASFVIAINFVNGNSNIYLYVLAVWMLITALGVGIGRVKRIRGQKAFDRSILGDLDNAIANASYQVVFSQIQRWNIIPLAIFNVLGVWTSGKSIGQTVLILTVMVIAYYVSNWEHNYYKSQKREVEALKKIALSE